MECKEFKKKKLLFIIFSFAIIANFCLDSFIPSASSMARNFSTQINNIEFGFAISTAGLSIGCFVFGILSLRMSRKSLGITALCIFILGEIICMQCMSLETFYLGRVIVGIGSGALVTVVITLLVEKFKGSELVKYNSYIMVILALLPAISPFIGGVVQKLFDHWRYNFFLPLLLGIVLLIFFILKFRDENIVLSKDVNIITVMKEYFIPLSEKKIVLSIIAGICTLGTLLFYTTVGPQIFESDLKLSALKYGALGVYSAIALISSSYINIAFSRYGLKKVMVMGNIFALFSGVLMLVLFYTVGFCLWTVILPATLFIFFFSFVHVNTLPLAVSVFKIQRGNLGAIFIFIQTLFASIFGIFASDLNIKNQSLIGITFVVIPIVLFVLMLLIFVQKKGVINEKTN